MLTIFQQNEDEILIYIFPECFVNYILVSCPGVSSTISESQPNKPQVRRIIFPLDYAIEYTKGRLLITSIKYKKRLSVVI